MKNRVAAAPAAREWIAVLDFGSQYTQLIARRVREQGVYSEIIPFGIAPGALRRRRPAGIILSGGPASVLDRQSPRCQAGLFRLGIPVLGICYGMQLTGQLLGGAVQAARSREYGRARLTVRRPQPLFGGRPRLLTVWMSHGDQVRQLPPGFIALAATATCPHAAMADPRRRIFGLQFHPEVAHTPRGTDILRRFLFAVCRCRRTWSASRFIQDAIGAVRARIGREQVICGLSGGVDSAVVAALLHRAVPGQLHCIFVDNGLLRAGEAAEVARVFGGNPGLDLRVADAGRLFLERLRGVTDPERKRKLIGRTFIKVFAQEARRLGAVKFLAQGTLYPDVIESRAPLGGPSATIKSHHNVGGLPRQMDFELIEPLRELFKDEVRLVGRELGLPADIVRRQPFPGPGLAVRILGAVTGARLDLLRQADRRVQEETARLAGRLWQAFAVLLPVHTVGVMGDARTYAHVAAIRMVESRDGMTADWARVPHGVLARISSRIINEVAGINRVVYDISSKPPATIEWE